MSRSWWHYWASRGHVAKLRVESHRSIDSSWFYNKRMYPFEEGEEPHIHSCNFRLFSSHAQATLPGGNDYIYSIPVVTTKCNYGGERHWFLCPIPRCRRRSKKLYLYPSGGVFVCRKCLNLAYFSQNRNPPDRIIDKKLKLIHKLGGTSDFIDKKPKRMHQKTFDRLQEEIWLLDELAEQKILLHLGHLFK